MHLGSVDELTVGCHADVDAFLISALLTLIPGCLVNHAVFIPFTIVAEILLDCPSEETLIMMK